MSRNAGAPQEHRTGPLDQAELERLWRLCEDCARRFATHLTLPAFQLTGTACVDLWIPYDPTLVGSRMHLQGLVVDPLANAFGAVLSNAAECVVGAK